MMASPVAVDGLIEARVKLMERAKALGVYEDTFLNSKDDKVGEVLKEHIIDVDKAKKLANSEKQPLLADETADDDAADVVGLPSRLHDGEAAQMAAEKKLYAEWSPVVEDLVDRYPRNPEDEGIYVAPPPLVAEWNMERYVSRLIREDMKRKLHFDDDGRVLLEPSPTVEGRVRPAVRGDVQIDPEALRTKYVTPVPHTGQDEWYDFRVELKSVTLTDHPLFTREDQLCQQLNELYNEYKRRQTVNLTKFYQDKVVAFRKDAEQLRRQIRELAKQKQAQSEGMTQSLSIRLINTLEHLLEARVLRDAEEAELAQNFKQIYKTWSQIRKWRDEKTVHMKSIGFSLERALDVTDQKGDKPEGDKALYIGQPMKLRVRQVLTDRRREEQEWTKQELDEMDERRELFELKRQWQPSRKANAMEEKKAELEMKVKQAEDTSSAPKPQEVEADPQVFDEPAVRSMVRRRMQSCHRTPGDPIYIPVMDKTGVTVTPDELCDPAERERRANIAKFRITLTFMVNNQEVTTTEPASLSFPSYSAIVNLNAGLRLLSVPTSIKCQISAVRFAGHTRIAEVFLPVPEFGAAGAADKFEFSGNRIEPTVELPSTERRFAGELEMLMMWDSQSRQAGAADAVRDRNPARKQDVMSTARRRNMIRAAQKQMEDMDPNDPRNAAIMELFRRARVADSKGRIFRASVFKKDLVLVDNGNLPESARRQVLRARYEGAFEAAVGLRDGDIPDSQFEYVDAQKGTEPKRLDDMAESARRQWRARQKMHRNRKTVSDVREVVMEGDVPEVSFSFNFMNTIFRPHRPLRIEREDMKPVASASTCSVVVQVIRAQNLPVRKGARMDAANVRAFVEVEFQEERMRTRVARGTNPMWNELMNLPFNNPGGYSPLKLQQNVDVVYFNVFDEITDSKAVDDKLKNSRTVRTEKRWLGRFQLPFTTIYSNGRVEGPIAVEIPLISLGYEKPLPAQPTVLWLYATIEPVLAPPAPVNELSQWRHRSPFLEYCATWQDNLRLLPQCKKRFFRTHAADINGDPKFICQFIGPQSPPDGMTTREFPRFVSIIPFNEDARATGGAEDVWCNSNEFLTLTSGDWEEHAILLCNYFKFADSMAPAAGWSTYVAIGSAVPEGRTLYVLRLHQQDGIIDQELAWNPVTGESFELRADFERCPLNSIGCIFDETNIWVNTQLTDAPHRLSYYLNNGRAWAPLFTSTFPRERVLGPCIQPKISYFQTSDDYNMDRAVKIERAIERRFEKWRVLPTRWNYGVSQILRDLLRDMEFIRQGRSDGVQLEDNKDLMKLKQIYAGMYGFPLNFSDTGEANILECADENPIVQAVQNTRLHETEDPNVVFALGVYIYPYPNRIGSIWIYVAALKETTD